MNVIQLLSKCLASEQREHDGRDKTLPGLNSIIVFGFKDISMREHNSSIELEIEAVI